MNVRSAFAPRVSSCVLPGVSASVQSGVMSRVRRAGRVAGIAVLAMAAAGMVCLPAAAQTETVLASFTGNSGAAPGANPQYGNLIQASDGNFYGMTHKGGASGDGTAFEMTSTGTVTVLHSFAGGAADGYFPFGSLVQGTDGNFYGMTEEGGSNYGTAFKMTPTGTMTLLHSFAAGAAGGGEYPLGSLVQGTDGNFYGLTEGAGSNYGTAFKMTSTGTVTLLHGFAGGAADGEYPYGSLVQGTDGNFYGLTDQGGASSGGTAFKMTSTGTVTLLHSFAGGTADGANPYGSLVQGTDGNFYGLTEAGGASSDGTVFKQTPATTLAAPVALSASATTVAPGGTFTLTYSVANAFAGNTNGTDAGNGTLGQCFALNTAGDTTGWVGVKSGSPTVVTSPSLTASSTAGTYTYSLTCGGMESNLVTITVPPPPAVTGLSPTSGPTSGGTIVTVTGTNFSGATAVHFGTAAAASFTVTSATSITAVSAASASVGAVDITVTTPGGTSTTSSADQFTYTQTTTTLTLTASPTSSTYGSIVTLTATVNNTAATGTVVFTNNGITLGSGTLSGGVAVLDATGLPIGMDSIIATYGGDSGDTAATSNTVVVTVSVDTTPVGSTSATQQVVFNFTSTVTLNSTLATAIQVVTQGTPNLDFKYVSGGSCAAGATYTSGQSCTVKFSFTPAAPGRRQGAVLLYSSAATPAVVATALVAGTGTGPQALFQPGVLQTTYSTSLNTGRAPFVDAAGNVFVCEYGNSRVLRYPAGSTSPFVVATVSANTEGVALDGAGNVFFTAINGSAPGIYELAAGSSTPVIINSSLTNNDNNMSIDNAGNLYTSNYSTGAIYELPAGNYANATTLIAGGSGRRFVGMALDANGNLFAVDANNNVLYELVAGATSLTTLASGSPLNQPQAVAIDAAENVYVENYQGSASVLRYAAGNYSGTPTTLAATGQTGISLGGDGSIYTMYGNATLYRYTRVTNPALSFASTAVGATSTAQTTLLENDGNAALTISSIAPSNNNFTFAGAVVGSNAACGTTLATAGVCGVSANFTPQTVGSPLTATGVVTDNSLNASGSTQTVPLSGTGTVGTKTISFATLTTPVTAGTSATLSATTSDNDPVTFSVTAGTATIGSVTTSTSGAVITYMATITYTNTGSVTVKADSATTANATDVNASQTVVVNAAATSFTATTEPVNTTSATQTAYITFATAGTPAFINLLTQGVAGLDYAFVSGGTCSTSTAYTVGQVCSVQYTFSPLSPGMRLGAVVARNSTGSLLANSFLSGIGTGPQALYTNGVLDVIANTTNENALTLDASGRIYYSDKVANKIYRIPAGGGSATTLATGVSTAAGVVVDGAGNIFYVSQGSSAVYELVGGSGGAVILSGVTGTNLEGITVDGAGNLYLSGSGVVKEYLASSTPSTFTASTSYGTGLTHPVQAALDTAGNVYIADMGTNKLVMVTANGATQTTIASGFSNLIGVAVDAAGNIYAGDFGATAVKRYTASTFALTTLSATIKPEFMALDAAGNLYVADRSNSRIVEFVRTAGTPVAFANTAVGASSAATSIPIENDGNTSLALSSVTASTTNFTAAYGTCSTALASGTTCAPSFTFTPQTAGALMATGVVTDNSLNVTSTQTVALTGTGTNVQPTVTSVSPNSGTTAGGTTVTITGTNFTGITSVNFGATAATSFTIVSSTSITAVSPAGAQGVVDITVANGTYTSATSAADQYTFLTASTITWNPSSHTGYLGVPIGTGVLDATSTTPGTITYTATNSSNVTVAITATSTLAVGSYTLTATLTPTSNTNATAMATISFTVVDQEVFVANFGTNQVDSYYDNGAQSSTSSGGGLGLAVNASGYVWSLGTGGGAVMEFSDTGGVQATYTATGLSGAKALTIDGNSVVWIAQGGSSNDIFALTSTGVVKSTTGFAQAGNISTPNAITVDTAGSLWISNTGNNTVTEVIGAAAPVTTPTVQQVIGSVPGAKP